LAVPLLNSTGSNRRRARTKKVLGNGVPQPLPKGSPIGQPSEIKRGARCLPAPRSTPTSPQFTPCSRFLDFDAGGIIANTADWLDQLHCIPFMRDVGGRLDQDKSYGPAFRHRVRAMGITEVVTVPRSPWQNPYAERLIHPIRRECLDHVIILDERHLRYVFLDAGATNLELIESALLLRLHIREQCIGFGKLACVDGFLRISFQGSNLGRRRAEPMPFPEGL
jgi:hypothetical protein